MSETENGGQSLSAKPDGKGRNKRIVVIVIGSLVVAALGLILWFDISKLRQQNLQLQSAVESLGKSEREQRAALLAESREHDQMISARQDSLEQEMQSIRDQFIHDRSEWMAAESDYLLRIANRRLTLERDVRGALLALRSVDGLLAEGANPVYLPVREQLRSEIQSLEAITPVDVDGIALELSALSKQLDTLPLATAPRDIGKTQAQEPQTDDEKSSVVGRFFSAMWSHLKGMVTVRRLDQKVLPLLPPEQRYFLTQNLRLRLETARLALLRGDAAIYQDNLNTASAWINEYFDHADVTVKHSREELMHLAQINIAPALPEIGSSLRMLEKIREKQPGRKPAAATRGRSS